MQRYGFEDAAREVQDLYLEGKKDEAMAALPDELIDTVSLCRARGRRARAAGRSTATPASARSASRRWPHAKDDRLEQLRLVAELAPQRLARVVRVLLGAFGDPGHAFPIIALGAELRARGHEVALQTWRRWRERRRGARACASPPRRSTTSSPRSSGR